MMSRLPTPNPAAPKPTGHSSSSRPATPSSGSGAAKPPTSSTGGPTKVGGGGGAASPPPSGATPSASPGGIPPIDQLQGRPIGRVLTKMGKVNRDQVKEALDFQKSKGGALGRILIDLGYIKEVDLN